MNFNFNKQLLRKDVIKVVITGFSRPRVRQSDFESAMTFYNLSNANSLKELLVAPIHIPKMDPSLVETYLKVIKLRETFCEPSIYPLYMRTVGLRLWYRITWLLTILGSAVAFNNVLYVVANN